MLPQAPMSIKPINFLNKGCNMRILIIFIALLSVGCSQIFDFIVTGEIKGASARDTLYVRFESPENVFSEPMMIKLGPRNEFSFQYRNSNIPRRRMDFIYGKDFIASFRLKADNEHGWVLVDDTGGVHLLDYSRVKKKKIVLISGLVLQVPAK